MEDIQIPADIEARIRRWKAAIARQQRLNLQRMEPAWARSCQPDGLGEVFTMAEFEQSIKQ